MSEVQGPQVHVERRDGGVVVVTLDDAKRKNAMTAELGDAFRDAIVGLRPECERGAVRAVVITGAGDAFSGGGDLAMLERLRSVSFTASYEFMLAFYRRYLSVLDLPVPTVAAVRGPAIGAGLAVALACDIVLFAEDAKLAVNFVALGLHPGMGVTHLLPARVGAERARELLFTGRRFSGRDAVGMGMGLEALADAEVMPRALALAGQIAEAGPLAVRACKKSLGVDRAALERALEREAFAQAESYASADLGEGLAAAKQRRKPSWIVDAGTVPGGDS